MSNFNSSNDIYTDMDYVDHGYLDDMEYLYVAPEYIDDDYTYSFEDVEYHYVDPGYVEDEYFIILDSYVELDYHEDGYFS